MLRFNWFEGYFEESRFLIKDKGQDFMRTASEAIEAWQNEKNVENPHDCIRINDGGFHVRSYIYARRTTDMIHQVPETRNHIFYTPLSLQRSGFQVGQEIHFHRGFRSYRSARQALVDGVQHLARTNIHVGQRTPRERRLGLQSRMDLNFRYGLDYVALEWTSEHSSEGVEMMEPHPQGCDYPIEQALIPVIDNEGKRVI